GPPDEDKEMLKEIKEAYKAPFEVHEDVLKELRRQYEQPSPDREANIFKELRRLYDLTDQQEAAIQRELRVAYRQPSAHQEERLFRIIQQAERLPDGAVPRTVQTEQARRLLQRLNGDGDGVLSAEEQPDAIRAARRVRDSGRSPVLPRPTIAERERRYGPRRTGGARDERAAQAARLNPSAHAATLGCSHSPLPTLPLATHRNFPRPSSGPSVSVVK